jgi:anti-sigma factor RsiW
VDFTSTIRKLKDLPSDGGHAVDVLAGANLRIFVRLKELEQAYGDLRARLATLEERSARQRPPVEPEARGPPSAPVSRRGLGDSAAARLAVRINNGHARAPTPPK